MVSASTGAGSENAKAAGDDRHRDERQHEPARGALARRGASVRERTALPCDLDRCGARSYAIRLG